MRIILVSAQYLGTITGSGGLYVLELSRELALRGHNVTILTLGIKEAEKEEIINLTIPKIYKNIKKCRVKIIRFWTSDSHRIKSPFEGTKEEEIKRYKEFNTYVLQYLSQHIDKNSIIHLNGHFMVPALSKEIKKLNTGKVVASIHSLESISEAKKEKNGANPHIINFIKSKEKDALVSADYIILWSPPIKDEISWIFSDIIQNIKLKVIPFGIPSQFLEETALSDEKKILLKTHYNITENFIFNLNRIDPSKGIEYLILAFPKFIKKIKEHCKNKSVKYSLLIGGLLEDKNLWYYKKLLSLKDQIDDKEIRENIHISTDSSIIDDKEYLHKMSKIFIMPSIISSFGMSLIESVIKGTPFVVSGIDGMLNILNIKKVKIPFSPVEGGTVVNFLNPITRVENLVQALFYVHNNHSKIQDSIKVLQKRLIKEYSWKKTIEQNISIYKKLIN